MICLTWAKLLGLASAAAGAAGTGFLFRGSFALIPIGGPTGAESIAATKAKNESLKRNQKIGLWLLLIGFALQGVAALVS